MWNIDDFADSLAAVIKASGDFNGVKVIRAYPDMPIPQSIGNPVIALSCGGFELDACEIGDSAKSGNAVIYASVFVPSDSGTKRLNLLLSQLANACAALNISSISTQGAEYDASADMIFAVLKISFYTYINSENQGGDGGE